MRHNMKRAHNALLHKGLCLHVGGVCLYVARLCKGLISQCASLVPSLGWGESGQKGIGKSLCIIGTSGADSYLSRGSAPSSLLPWVSYRLKRTGQKTIFTDFHPFLWVEIG